MRLLFAEDDRDLQRAVKTLLERAGYLVDAVSNGEDAVEYAAAEEYDGLIFDWMMPKLDGVEALRRLRGRGVSLLARVRAMLRRRDSYKPDLLTFEDLTLDKGSCELRCGSARAQLSGKAYQLMALFMENPRHLFSVQQLMDKIWGWDAEAEINVVWVNISQLRKRLTELGTCAEIRARRGTGYSLEKKA